MESCVSYAPLRAPEIPEYFLEGEKWAREVAAAKAARERQKRGKVRTLKIQSAGGRG